MQGRWCFLCLNCCKSNLHILWDFYIIPLSRSGGSRRPMKPNRKLSSARDGGVSELIGGGSGSLACLVIYWWLQCVSVCACAAEISYKGTGLIRIGLVPYPVGIHQI